MKAFIIEDGDEKTLVIAETKERALECQRNKGEVTATFELSGLVAHRLEGLIWTAARFSKEDV